MKKFFNNRKNCKIITFFVLMFIAINFSLINKIQASEIEQRLITVGTGQYQITVKKTTTVNDIIKVLGKAKVETDSVFGGKAYTFYTGNDYNNYLYIETTKDGKIASYGSVDPSYKIYDVNTQGYGEGYDYYNNYLLHGYLFSDSGTVKGGVYYNSASLYGDSPNADRLMINYFQDTYMSNPTKYLRGISEQAVTMYNALSTMLGNKTNLVFNEDFFYINEQFEELGTSTREYIRNMNKTTAYMKTIGLAENVEVSTYGYYLLSPMYWADLVKNIKNIKFGEKNQAVFYYDENTKELFACGLKADVYNKMDSIELTSDEKSKLSAGRYEYNQSKINFNKDKEIYEIEPVINNPSQLVAGKLKASKEQGILDYVNAIRVGAGLNKLTLDRGAYTTAQYLATLTSYRWNVLKLDIQHYPPKPEGVTDEYYKIAVEDGASYSENIGRISNETTVENMKMHINQFIDESAENPQLFGHRKALLNNYAIKFGYGVSPNIGVNEFVTGSRNKDNFIEAWPSKGITFMESYTQRTKWTIQFVDKYKITDNTTVLVKCLNTNKTYEFNEEKNTDRKVFLRHMNSAVALNNKVVLYDSGIVPQAGEVYEITLNNVKDEDTGKNTSYTYRTVFEYADTSNYPSNANSIKINTPNLSKVKDQDVYYLPLNEEVNLDVTIDNDVVDKKVTWISSNPDAVEVKQNGTIIAKKLTNEDVTITVSYDSSNITDQIVVRPYEDVDVLNLNETHHQFNSLTELFTLKPTTTSGVIPTDVSYSLNNNDQKVAAVDLAGKITPKKGGFATVNVKSTKYGTKKFYVYVNMPISLSDGSKGFIGDMNRDGFINNSDVSLLSSLSNPTSDEVLIADINNDGSFTTEDVTALRNYIVNNFTSGPYKPIKTITLSQSKVTLNLKESTTLTATITPDDTTDSKKLIWESSNTKVADVSDNGKITPKKSGTTIITVKTKSGVSTTCTVTVNGISITKVMINKKTVKLSPNEEETLKAVVFPTDTTDVEDISWKSDTPQVATIDDNGKVTAKQVGEASITATTSNGKISTTKVIVKDEYFKDSTKYYKYEGKPGMSIGVFETEVTNKNNEEYLKYTSSNNEVINAEGTINSPMFDVGGFAIITATSAQYGDVRKIYYVDMPVELSNGKYQLAGDLNNNKTFDLKDIEEYEKLIKKTSFTEDELKVADINNDGVINEEDQQILFEVISNKYFQTDFNLDFEIDGPTNINLSYIDQREDYNITSVSNVYKSSSSLIPPKPINPHKVTVNWSTSDNNKATVEYGQIVFKSPGTVDVIANVLGVEKRITVTVTKVEIQTVYLDRTDITLEEGKTDKLKAGVTPSNAFDRNKISWTSSKEEIASVTQYGEITAKKEGTTTITAQAPNGKKAECQVTVVKKGSISYIKGDINRDKFVDVKDAMEVLSRAVGTRPITFEDLLIADFNGNRMLESSDAIEILKLYLNKE